MTPRPKQEATTAGAGTPPGLSAVIPKLLGKLSQVSPRLAVEIGLWAFFLAPRRMRVRPEQSQVLTQATRTVWRHNGHRLPVWQWGEGPRVLLLHGWGGRAAQMTGFVPALVAAGFQPVAIDGPAHGQSSGRRTSVAGFARAAVALAQHLGGFDSAITHSLGGSAVALALRGGLHLRRAVFVSPPTDLEHFLGLFLRSLRVPPEQQDRTLNRVAKMFAIARGGLAMSQNLSAVKLPFLAIHDRHDDKAAFADTQQLASELSHGQLLETEGLGHNRILASAQVIEAATNFLKEDLVDDASAPAPQPASVP